jgi:hypothetical protein
MRQVGVTIDALRAAIVSAGGGANALDDAEALHGKVMRIASEPRARPMLDQLLQARDAGDFRGRALEVNVAACFVQAGLPVEYGVKQPGCSGDIDLMFRAGGPRVHLELKHLGHDQQTRRRISAQLQGTNGYCIRVDDDLCDVVRLQRNIVGKASTHKFNPIPAPDAVNLVGIDVSELQLATIDLGDCLLAAGGNSLAARYCHPSCLREGVVGVFEDVVGERCSPAQRQWITECHQVPGDARHPRDYLHGAVFLFRDRPETAALSYELRSVLVWNSRLVPAEVRSAIGAELHRVVPPAY